jgi:hypothetical protein
MSRLFTSHYERLGVPIHATRGEIRSAFIRLAKVHHPDVSASQDSEREFVALKQAFDVLNDPQQRELYTSQLSRRGTPEESYYQPPPSDDRSRQRRTLRRAGKDLITRGMEGMEQLEKELEGALDRAYHGPLFDPTEEQAFPPCFELEEANSLLRDSNGTVEVLHVVCGRSFLGHVLWNPATAGPYTLELLTGSSSASLSSVARATRDEDGNVVFEARNKGEDEWRRVARLRGSDSTLLALEEKERERETHKVLRSRAPGVQSLLFYSKLGFLEFRGDRAWLPPSSLWVWEPRDTRFSTGGWYFETNHQGRLTHARFSSMRRAGRGKALGEAMADMARDWGFGGPENGKDDQPQAAPQPSVKEGSCISPRGGSFVDKTRNLDASIVILLAGFMTLERLTGS